MKKYISLFVLLMSLILSVSAKSDKKMNLLKSGISRVIVLKVIQRKRLGFYIILEK